MTVLLTYVFRVSAGVSVSSLSLFRFVYVWLLLLCNAPTCWSFARCVDLHSFCAPVCCFILSIVFMVFVFEC